LKDFYLNGAIVNIDDTAIYGSDVERFQGILDQSQMAEFNVRLNPSKCFFGVTTIEFLSHVFEIKTSDGGNPSDCRVQKINDFPVGNRGQKFYRPGQLL